MQRMRVSSMRITKQGQVNLRDGRAPRETPVDREALQERMREAARKQGERLRDRERLEAERAAAAASRPRTRRAHTPGGSPPRRSGGEPEAKRPWRYDFLVQAAVCGMILLAVVGFRAVDTPVTNQISGGIAQMVTMDVDVGKDLGRLQFVRNIVPDSVLTFWESTSDGPDTFAKPFEGDVALSYTEDKPGIVYTGEGPGVYCAADGVVQTVTSTDDGGYVLRVRHDGGIDTVYALLQGVKVAAGESVTAGQEIAVAMPGGGGSRLYFQALRAGKAFDPMPMLQP